MTIQFGNQGVPTGLTVKQSMPSRVMRRPQHTFHLRHRPFQIQPFMIAPVLAGETLKNVLFQSRCVTDPIQNPLIGWWLEHYLFYIPLRRIDGSVGSQGTRTVMESMLLDLSAPLSHDNANDAACYHYGVDTGGVNFARDLLNIITEEYFRDEGEVATDFQLDGVPQAQIRGKSWLDSVNPASDLPTTPLDTTDNQTFDSAYQTWQILRQQQLIEMTYEEYLQSFGIRQPQAQDPLGIEIIRTSSQWSYPTNTVGTSGDDLGVPSSAVSWSVQERADKDRFFREPGFIFGVTVARPKVYLANQRATGSSMLMNALNWLPALMKDQVETSLQLFAEDTGPLAEVYTGEGYWVDIRDLFVHGDQFVNFALTATDAGLVALPVSTSNAASRYVSDANVDALFVDSADANGLTRVRQDGVVNLGILGTQMDHT